MRSNILQHVLAYSSSCCFLLAKTSRVSGLKIAKSELGAGERDTRICAAERGSSKKESVGDRGSVAGKETQKETITYLHVRGGKSDCRRVGPQGTDL